MSKVIGVLGKPGAGKDTFVRMLEETLALRGYAIEVQKFSDVLGEMLDARSLEKTTANLQWMAQQLEWHEGKGALSRYMHERLRRSQSYNHVVVVNGVRWLTDAELIRSLPNNLLVYVTTDARKRYLRKKDRGEREDDTTLTWERFLEEDAAPNEQYIETIGAGADVIIDNNEYGGDVLREKVSRFLNEDLFL